MSSLNQRINRYDVLNDYQDEQDYTRNNKNNELSNHNSNKLLNRSVSKSNQPNSQMFENQSRPLTARIKKQVFQSDFKHSGLGYSKVR